MPHTFPPPDPLPPTPFPPSRTLPHTQGVSFLNAASAWQPLWQGLLGPSGTLRPGCGVYALYEVGEGVVFVWGGRGGGVCARVG